MYGGGEADDGRIGGVDGGSSCWAVSGDHLVRMVLE